MKTLGRTTDPHKRKEKYENQEAINWILDPVRIKIAFPKWNAFVKEQEQIRQLYRERAQIGQFSRALTFTKQKMFMHSWRIPVKIDEILIKLDPELDGSNMKKMNAFLADFPVFDLRQRAAR